MIEQLLPEHCIDCANAATDNQRRSEHAAGRAGTEKISPDCDVAEALRLLLSEQDYHMLLVTSEDGNLTGILTKTDILSALQLRGGGAREAVYEATLT